MSKPVGGRGKKAPYQTKLVRIPVDLEPQVKELVNRFHGDDVSPSPAIQILKGALNLRPNAGGAIKAQIREALALLESPPTGI